MRKVLTILLILFLSCKVFDYYILKPGSEEQMKNAKNVFIRYQECFIINEALCACVSKKGIKEVWLMLGCEDLAYLIQQGHIKLKDTDI